MIRPRSTLSILAVAAVALAACDDQTTAPRGAPSDVTVRAYVDADGSGDFGSGDRPIEGATVTLAGTDADRSFEETTDARGVATFGAVPPGSYEATFAGTPPEGAVLASARTPTVVADFRGGEVSAEFRYAFLPGAISGVIFRNDNETAGFQADEDTPAPGMPVALFAGTAAGGEPLATGRTGADGSFGFDGLRPGDYTVAATPFETTEIVDGNTRTVTVSPDATTELPIEFTGNLVITIAEARAREEGETVTVEGVVTWQTQWDDRVYFFQDSTAGISAFDFTEPQLEIGDSIRVTGERDSFSGEVQIGFISNVEILGNVGAPEPQATTAAEIGAGELQGELVTLDATVEAVHVINSFGTHIVEMSDLAGDPLTVFVDNRTGVSADDWQEGELYRVTGVLGAFEGDPQLEVRFPEDMVLGGSAITVAEARGEPEGTKVTVEGTVTWQQEWDARVYYFQDGTGGLTTFDFNEPGLQRGDRIRIRGEVGSFRDELQLSPVDFTTVTGHPGVPQPRTVSAQEIRDGEFQAELVTIEGTAESIETFSFDNHLVTFTNDAGTEFNVFVDSRTGISSGSWEVGARYSLTGVLTTANFDDDPPEAGDRQLEPRDPGDREKLN